MTGHGPRSTSSLTLAAALLAALLVGELVAGLVAGSLVLVADAGHVLVDVLALAMAVAAARLAERPATPRWTFGLARAEVLSAAVNGVTLVVVAAVVTVEAVRRLVHPSAVHGAVVLVLALVGLAVNVVAAAVLHRADLRSLNVRAAVAHVVTDAWAFLATVVAGVLLVTTGWHRADAVASLVVVALLLRAALPLLRESAHVLLEAAPEHVDLSVLRRHLLDTEHVLEVHDLHAWTVTSHLPAVSAHVVVSDACFTAGDAPRILDELQACLGDHFDVTHSTFQLEAAGHSDHEPASHA